MPSSAQFKIMVLEEFQLQNCCACFACSSADVSVRVSAAGSPAGLDSSNCFRVGVELTYPVINRELFFCVTRFCYFTCFYWICVS